MAKGHLNFLAFSNAHRICKYGGGLSFIALRKGRGRYATGALQNKKPQAYPLVPAHFM